MLDRRVVNGTGGGVIVDDVRANLTGQWSLAAAGDGEQSDPQPGPDSTASLHVPIELQIPDMGKDVFTDTFEYLVPSIEVGQHHHLIQPSRG